MSLETPGAEVWLPSTSCNQLEAGNMHFGKKALLAWVVCSFLASNRQRHLFSASIVPWSPQICGKHMCTHSSMTSLPALKLQSWLNTPGGQTPNNKDPHLANGKALPKTSAAVAERNLVHHPSTSLAGTAETTLTLTELSWLEVASVYSLSGCQSRPCILERWAAKYSTAVLGFCKERHCPSQHRTPEIWSLA